MLQELAHRLNAQRHIKVLQLSQGLGEKAGKVDTSNGFCVKRQFPFYITNHHKKKKKSTHTTHRTLGVK